MRRKEGEYYMVNVRLNECKIIHSLQVCWREGSSGNGIFFRPVVPLSWPFDLVKCQTARGIL